MDILDGLNSAQREAVEYIKGPLLILAGPGSGKTRVITSRIAYLVNLRNISPYRIIAVTFTNKAAKEMRERLSALLNTAADELTLGTFHALCARILRIEGRNIGLDREFVIYDSSDSLGMIKRCLQDLNLDPKQHPPKVILSEISSAKAKLWDPSDMAKHSRSYFEEIVQRVYARYQKLLTESVALDFDDLLMKTVYLFSTKPDILAKYQARYIHVLVDEFQDTNTVQYTMAKQLAGQHRNICVVGDPDQSIYSWRYADIRNILSFEHDYPDAKVIYLEQNYRSTKTILEAASNIISSNRQRKDKKLWTDNKMGAPITVVEAYDELEEAQFIVNEVEHLVKSKQFKLNDCAVMYRTNAQSRAIEEAFVRYKIPYRLVGATRFYERREIRDVLAYLKLIGNPSDSINLMRIVNVPGRGIGQQSLAELVGLCREQGVSFFEGMKTLAEQKRDSRLGKKFGEFIKIVENIREKATELSVSQLIDLIIERTGYKEFIMEEDNGEERMENILELRSVAGNYDDLEPEEGLSAFLEGVALVSDIDNLDTKVEAATLITLHQAKGLEFPVVIIAGVEEKLLPHARSLDNPEQMEEERRLCYVGVTRAKERLYLVHASGVTSWALIHLIHLPDFWMISPLLC
ncbi:MAG: UvrD-helicase domain-containing protein [Chloroflexi bacterium]|nr:UvrD-helicase domain-containing protein [Chloroflexota bacterium]